MELNKDYIIISLTAIVILVIGYIFFKEPTIKEIVKTKYKTVVKDNIVYRDKECPKYTIEKQKSLDNTPSIDKEIIKEYVLASTSDVSHRYTISLFSYDELPKINSFTKIVLNGNIKDNDIDSIFIMDVNQELLDNINNVYFKVIDNQTKKTYINHDSCLYNTIANYIYKTDLVISGEEVMCSIIEDRELEEKDQGRILGGKLNKNVKNTFLNMNSNTVNNSK